MIEQHEITGVILCGGRGTRMEGLDKPLQLVSGMPLVQHVRQRLVPQVGAVIVSANRHLPDYAAWGDVVVPDGEPDLGPLGGLLAALDHVTTPYLFCCPGDAPLMSRSLVAMLAAPLSSSKSDVAVPTDGVRMQHLFVLMRVTVRDALRAYLASGERSVGGWVASTNHITVDMSREHNTFANINTEEERIALEQQLRTTEV